MNPKVALYPARNRGWSMEKHGWESSECRYGWDGSLSCSVLFQHQVAKENKKCCLAVYSRRKGNGSDDHDQFILKANSEIVHFFGSVLNFD